MAERSLPFGDIGGFGPHGFEPRSIQPDDLNIDTCHFLARCLALLGQGKDWLAQCQDNVTEWDIRCWQLGLPVQQHYTIDMSVHCLKSVPILI